MITKSEWQAINRQLMSDDRRNAGDPPAAEEMLAYTRGELTAEQEASVRERLVCHPDLVRTLTEPFPTEGASPGDADYMPDEEFARHWASMQKRIRRKDPRNGRVLQFWRISTALAAALALTFSVLFIRARSKLNEPQAITDIQELSSDAHRGPADVQVLAHGDRVLLVAPLIGPREHEQYRLDIRDVQSNRSVWKSEPLRVSDEQPLAIVVSGRFLQPGKYKIIVLGISGSREEEVATYSLRVPSR